MQLVLHTSCTYAQEQALPGVRPHSSLTTRCWVLDVQVPVPTGPAGLDVDGLQTLLEQPGAPR